MYSLNKTTGYSTSTIHDAIHQLIAEELVKQEAKGFSLTVRGLISVLQEESLWSSIDQIIKANKTLVPQYFGLWPVFEKNNVKDIAIILLKFSINKLQGGVPAFPEKIGGKIPTLQDWLPKMAIYPYEAFSAGLIHEQEVNWWLDMIMSTPEAEKLFLSVLHWMIDSHKSAMESFARVLELYEKEKDLRSSLNL